MVLSNIINIPTQPQGLSGIVTDDGRTIVKHIISIRGKYAVQHLREIDE